MGGIGEGEEGAEEAGAESSSWRKAAWCWSPGDGISWPELELRHRARRLLKDLRRRSLCRTLILGSAVAGHTRGSAPAASALARPACDLVPWPAALAPRLRPSCATPCCSPVAPRRLGLAFRAARSRPSNPSPASPSRAPVMASAHRGLAPCHGPTLPGGGQRGFDGFTALAPLAAGNCALMIHFFPKK